MVKNPKIVLIANLIKETKKYRYIKLTVEGKEYLNTDKDIIKLNKTDIPIMKVNLLKKRKSILQTIQEIQKAWKNVIKALYQTPEVFLLFQP